jgi:hypothetical protein
LDRYRQALEAGTDPAIVAAWISQVTKERTGVQARLAEAELRVSEIVTPAELRAQIEAIGGLLALLDASDPVLKARFYDEVGIEGVYDPKTQSVAIEARVPNGRVGGGDAGWPGASQPPAPTDPDVKVSLYPARLTRHRQSAWAHCHWANRPGCRAISPSHHRLNRL